MGNQHYTEIPDEEEVESFQKLPQASSTARRRPWHLIFQALLIISNLSFLGLWLSSASTDCIRPKLVKTPAKEAIRYEKKRLWRSIESDNVYAGDPRPEHDAAWSKLIEPITIKVSKSDLDAINGSSLALKDGSGYIAETAMYHELHCMKRVRRHLHLKHYYPHMTEDERLREGPHIDHCLEYWREAALCRGDMSISTFKWVDGKPSSHVYSDHECVDWSALDAWARNRMVDMSDYSILDIFES